MIDGKFRCINSGGIMVSTVDRGDNPSVSPPMTVDAIFSPDGARGW